MSFTFVLYFFCLLLYLSSGRIANATYALISFHGGSSGVENIFRYSLPDGTLLGPVIGNASTVDQLRGLVWYPTNNQLYFLNAHKSHNDVELLQSSYACADPGMVSDHSKSKLSHPYSLVLKGSHLYVSDQDSGNIVKMPLDLSDSKVIAVVSNPRGMVFGNDGLLYVASQGLESVVYINVTTEKSEGSFPASKPISLVPYEDLIIYGTRGKDTSIHGWSTTTKKDVWTMTNTNLLHAAGMVVDDAVLYVLSQETKALLLFDLNKQVFIGVMLSDLPDFPEDLAIIHC